MTGDITRDTFDRENGYTAVRAQQGRVMLDADHNEWVDIQRDDVRGGRRDLIGSAGAPADNPGFGVELVGGIPTLTAGRFLLEGARLRNDAALSLSGAQPFLPDAALPDTAGEWLAYLEAWDEPVSAVEAPNMREVALGGPDTTFRERQVWQVRWLRLGNAGAGTSCSGAAAILDTLASQFDGTLQPELDSSTITGPCIVSEAAEFRGPDHQAYRIEIHAGNIGVDGAALPGPVQFKWSRDNAAIIGSAINLVSDAPIILAVERLGPGGAEGFERGVMIEISSARQRLAGQPGLLARVEDVAGDTLTLTLLGVAVVADLQSVLGEDGVVVRRWDSVDLIDVDTTAAAEIEDGLLVRFGTGNYRSGDYWILPLRTSVVPGRGTQIDWPSTGGNHEARSSQAPERYRVALAILDFSASTWSLVRDCRVLYPPLGTILSLSPAGGDGQHGVSGEWLPAPVMVRAMRGRLPAPNQTLRFTVNSGGMLAVDSPASSPATASTQDVVTDETGTAMVYWQLGPGPVERQAADTWEPATSQRVEIVTLGPDGLPGDPSLTYTAQVLDHRNLSVVGGNAQHGRPGERLEIALRVRIDEGSRPVTDAVVEFAVLNLVFEGQALNQNSGGNLLASARFVSGDTWPGGTAHHTVRTTTDQDGVAQVQWTLGTLTDLTTQRVEARLLDANNNTGAQRALFTAQLALADQTAWLPNVPWLTGAVGAANRQVQAAIDTIATRIEAISIGTPAFDPFVDLHWRSTTNNALTILGPQTVVGLQNLAALSFRSDLVPAGRNTSTTYPHGGIVVAAEIPDPQTGLLQVVRLNGNVRRATSGQRWEWTLASSTRANLANLVSPFDDGLLLVVRVGVVPRWLPGGQEGDSTLSFESAFRILVGSRILIDDFILDGIILDRVVTEHDIMRGGVIRNGRIIGDFTRRG
jgi:hypothetical protein